MNTIRYEDTLKIKEKVYIDVRTPLEFAEDHIGGAVNIPVLSNDERALVGTIYKKESSEKAVDLGIDFFSKRLPEISTTLRKFAGKKIIAYCWRGGMRSRAFVSFLHSLNFDIVQLDGGYKSFRAVVREGLYSFEIKNKLITIYGMTGSGKTEIINKLYPESIDLEGLAQHRSSLFGHVGLNPRSQKVFEHLLYDELIRVEGMPYVFVEGESRRIGNVNIPENFFDKML